MSLKGLHIKTLFTLVFSLFLINSPSTTMAEAANTIHAQKVDDSDIEQRLKKIFAATGWFAQMQIEVTEGLVIITGQVESDKNKDWAIDIINKTEGVVAVIDKLDASVSTDSVLKPAQDELRTIYSATYKLLPYLVSAFILLFLFLLVAYLSKKAASAYFVNRHYNPLVTKSLSNIIAIVFLILGFYFALKTSGLSALAVTLLGGTGMLGIGLGLALKSTFENYASSIMISLKELLRMGEIVNINGFEGIVQSVTTRGTTLMDYEGNNIIIPNTDVFNSPIKNLTRNPKMRANFLVGIGYDDDICKARSVILNTLKKLQPAILEDPESMVAVDNLGASTVNLNVYFWFDAINVSLIKIKSLVIQEVKEALVAANISLPDDAREVVFASPLQIQNIQSLDQSPQQKLVQKLIPKKLDGLNTQKQDLDNEVKDLQKQARQTPHAESGTNLI